MAGCTFADPLPTPSLPGTPSQFDRAVERDHTVATWLLLKGYRSCRRSHPKFVVKLDILHSMELQTAVSFVQERDVAR